MHNGYKSQEEQKWIPSNITPRPGCAFRNRGSTAMSVAIDEKTELLKRAQDAEQERRKLIERGEIKVATIAWRSESPPPQSSVN